MNKQVEGLIIGTLIIILTLLLGLLFPAPGAAAPPPVAFASAVNYAVGTNPYAVTSGDFNGDGKLDLAAANSVDGTVSVLLGNGDGTFQNAVNYNLAPTTFPTCIAAGDFNGDGKPDLAVGDDVDGNITLLLGDGAGNFTLKISNITGYNSYSIVAGDFNGDGKPDLAITDYYNAGVSIWLGKGDGTFTLKNDYPVGNSPAAVVVGDFNDDGKPDLAVACYDGLDVYILRGNGDGTFTQSDYHYLGYPASAIVSADFDGDGKPDLALANDYLDTSGNPYDGYLLILRGNGNGTFQAPTSALINNYSYAIIAGDFNGDHKPDLAITDYYNGVVSLWLGNGDGTFTWGADYPIGLSAYSAVGGDFNGDGEPDLAAANWGDNNISVLINTTPLYAISGHITLSGTGLKGVKVTLGGDFSAIGYTDINGDYGFIGLAQGNYTVTPCLTGYDFSPAYLPVTLSVADAGGQDFTASGNCSISGTVTRWGAGLSGVNIALTGAQSASVTTGAGGNYTFSGLIPGSYAITPGLSGYIFTPASRNVTIASGNTGGQNFTASGNCSVSGTVTRWGTGLNGVNIALTGAQSGSATTNSLGKYTFYGLVPGSYTLTASLSGYIFSPAFINISLTSANATGADFTATGNCSISGTLTKAGVGLAGINVYLSGAQSGTTSTDAAGKYSFSSLVPGSYTIIPCLKGQIFNPLARNISLTANNGGNQNFIIGGVVSSTYTLVGRVVNKRGMGISGVTITITNSLGCTQTTVTNYSGAYGFPVVPGIYTVNASKNGFNFTPASITVNTQRARRITVNFLQVP